MKLPFSNIIGPVIKPHLGTMKSFCEHPTFSYSILYTYFYSTLGFLVSANHLKNHLGEDPGTLGALMPMGSLDNMEYDVMIMHDLKIISSSMSLVQYVCLLAGCITGNPALFLPHLGVQMVMIAAKMVHALFLLKNWKSMKRLKHMVPAIALMGFNWLQEFCVFRKHLCIYGVLVDSRWSYLLYSWVNLFYYNRSDDGSMRMLETIMETESNTILDQLILKHENHPSVGFWYPFFFGTATLFLLFYYLQLSSIGAETSEGVRVRLRALLVALLGISMSACAFASQPVELELDDDEVAQKLNNVSFARKITKPTIRLVIGYGKFSAFVTAATSLLLLVSVMSKRAWWRRGTRWLAAPALLVAALEAASDASDALITAVLRGSAEPARVVLQTAAAAVLVTVEILVWYFIAKFFQYNPPLSPEEREKKSLIDTLPQ